MPTLMIEAGADLPRSAVIVYSGGLDSTALLYAMRRWGVELRGAITLDYGQKHRKEIDCAKRICASLELEHKIVDLSAAAAIFGNSSLTDRAEAIPQGHYEEDSMKSTVVPNRNMILISIAAAYAIGKQAEAVAYAAHSGDHAIYPDCRETFAEALDRAIQLCDWSPLRLYRPFVKASKADIVQLGTEAGAPLQRTWSCYEGKELHCGQCGTCVERREAFDLAGIEDPTAYEASAPPLEALLAKGKELAKNI